MSSPISSLTAGSGSTLGLSSSTGGTTVGLATGLALNTVLQVYRRPDPTAAAPASGFQIGAQKQPFKPWQLAPNGIQLLTEFWCPPDADIRIGDLVSIDSIQDFPNVDTARQYEVILVDQQPAKDPYLIVHVKGAIR